MKYLVTGALGAIGAWTVRSLLDHGHEVVTYDLGGSDHRLRLALTDDELDSITKLTGDVTDLAQMETAIEENGVEALIHLAALQVPFVREDPVAGARVDVVGTVHALEAARRYLGAGPPVVYASSIAALAPEPGLHPSTLYGVYKFANEGAAELYFADYGVSSIGLRPHTVYGPGRDQGLTSAPTAAMAAAAAGQRFRIPFGGSLQFQYVADAGEAFVRASEASYEGASVHNLDGPVATMQELIGAIELAAPETEGLVTAAEEPLPFPPSVDATSFVELVGGPLARPLADGVAETMARFRR
jgi:UDP-glucuronate 4-epimerase